MPPGLVLDNADGQRRQRATRHTHRSWRPHHHVRDERNGLPADVAADDGGPTGHLLGDRVRYDGAGQGELNGRCVDDAHLPRQGGSGFGRLAQAGSPEVSFSARSRFRLPKLRPGRPISRLGRLGRALAGQGLCFRHRCARHFPGRASRVGRRRAGRGRPPCTAR